MRRIKQDPTHMIMFFSRIIATNVNYHKMMNSAKIDLNVSEKKGGNLYFSFLLYLILLPN